MKYLYKNAFTWLISFICSVIMLSNSPVTAQFSVTQMPKSNSRPQTQNQKPSSSVLLTDNDASLKQLASEFVSAKYAEKACPPSDGVRLNLTYFRNSLNALGGHNPYNDHIIEQTIYEKKTQVASEIRSMGAEEFCDQYTTNVFWNADKTNPPIFYHDELGQFWGPERSIASDPLDEFLNELFGQ
jgi:hypothetical protein